MSDPKRFTWCSFAGETGWLGGVFLEGHLSAAEAIDETNRLGINPGGEVMAIQIEPDLEDERHARLAGRLLSQADCEAEFGLISTRKAMPDLEFDCLDQGEPN